MEEDDQLDSALTELGERQAAEAGRRGSVKRALRNVDLVVSSPLSRCLRTADLVHSPSPPSSTSRGDGGASPPPPRRVFVEDFREINGRLLNARRLPRADLEREFPHWCFRRIPPEDESWTPELETREACARRGYEGLRWVMRQREGRVLVVCHGGLLSYTMNDTRRVVLVDGRRKETHDDDGGRRCITKRFENCELREFIVTAWESSGPSDERNDDDQPLITLEEVTLGMECS